MPTRRLTTLVAAITLTAAATALAHVAPSVDDNNRYLKLTPLGDRVRIAYTVFFGEVPGATERRGIDKNRDGRIDPAEARAFGESLAAQIAQALELEVDGHGQPITWAAVDVGMNDPVVAGGAFSVDLVAYACLAQPHGQHHVRIKDRFRVPRPGETEAKVDDSPGVTIQRARVGAADDPTYDYRFAGPGGPMSEDGLDLIFTAGSDAPVADDGTCRGAALGAARPHAPLPILIAALAAIAGAAAYLMVRRAKKRAAGEASPDRSA